MYQLRAHLQEASCHHNMCGWKGTPVLLLAVRYKLHAGGFDDNMVLPPGASSEATQKAEPESSTKGITSCCCFFSLLNTLNSFSIDKPLLLF